MDTKDGAHPAFVNMTKKDMPLLTKREKMQIKEKQEFDNET